MRLVDTYGNENDVSHILDVTAQFFFPTGPLRYVFVYDSNGWSGSIDRFNVRPFPGSRTRGGDVQPWINGALPQIMTGDILITP